MGFKRDVLDSASWEITSLHGVDWVEGPLTEDGETFLELERSNGKIYRVTIERVA